ncbi:MAG: D-aminoacylase [Acidobacteria bacterium]|nr:D-aminoacylase [Acidobacteriota bacterium]
MAPFLGAQSFDVIISGGRVLDGAGSPWFYADVGIRGDTIAAVGDLTAAGAEVKLDAKGFIVAPGFIDIHSHGRRNIFKVPSADNLIRQGVTTILEGNDGSSPLPLGAYLDKLARTPISINVGFFAGHGSIREAVVGLANRAATAEELDRMKALTRQAMHDGAFGVSTGLFYVPGNYAATEEVIALARVAGEHGGMHISHMRDEAAAILDSVRETIRIGEEGGLPTQLTHHKIIGKQNWGASRETLKLVDEARRRGVDVTIDQYPYTASSTGTAALFPQWSLEGGRKAMLERLAAPEALRRIKAEIVRRIEDDRGGGDPANVQLASCDFDHSLDGKTLADVARARAGKVTLESAADAAVEIQTRGGCSAVYHAINEEDVRRIMTHPATMIASDGGISEFGKEVPHPRGYGTFARVLARYTRQLGVLTLEEAVRKMTGLPAARLKLHDRGLLRPGLKADIVIFDPAIADDKATFGDPHQYAEGFRHVLVNGKLAVRHTQVTAERPGRVLRRP